MLKSKKKSKKEVAVIQSFKAFNKDMKCRDLQYEIGKKYTHQGEVKACGSGFHACEYPIDMFSYYAPADSVFATVEQTGEISREADGDSKVASSVIEIKAAIDIPGIIKAAIQFTTNRCDPVKAQHSKGNQSASSATGDRSASSATGNQSASSATGNQSASSATGDRSASSATGNQSASSATGNQSASSATGDRSASSATGDRSASSATGDRSASITTGWYASSEIKGNSKESVAVGVGYENKARAVHGCWIVLAHRNDDDNRTIKHIKSAQAGVTEGVKADTWYTLNADGEFVEAA